MLLLLLLMEGIIGAAACDFVECGLVLGDGLIIIMSRKRLGDKVVTAFHSLLIFSSLESGDDIFLLTTYGRYSSVEVRCVLASSAL